MNRNIYGLTLFLFIVKTHFLLYWLFFAPINFVSTIETPETHSSLREYVTGSKCTRNKERSAVLQNVAFDFENMKVSANVRFNNLETAFEANDFDVYLSYIGDEKYQTIILKPIYGAEAGKVVAYQGKLPASEKWDGKTNYNALINFEYGRSPKGFMKISASEQPIPVLIITDKNR